MKVIGHRLVEKLDPTATKLRIQLDLSDANEASPRHICIKAMLGDLAAMRGMGGIGMIEARFYDEVAGPLARVGVLTPACHFIGLDQEAEPGRLVMEDLIASGASFLSALTPYSPDEARLSLDQMARMHAASWNLPAPYDRPWISSRLEAMGAKPMLPCHFLRFSRC
jgi:hypothetical protein